MTKNGIFKTVFIFSFLYLGQTGSVAAHVKTITVAAAPKDFTSKLKQEISKNYGHARIEFIQAIRWIKGTLPSEVQSVSILEEDAKGNAHFLARGSSGQNVAEGWVSFAAWVNAKVALRRIHPMEKLSTEAFTDREVNVSSGQARDFRGLILSPKVDLSKLETIQTILEGQFLVTNAVRSLPDVRRGEPVRIHLKSGELVLTTQGIAEEPGYLSQQLRVMTNKGKRQLIGRLIEDGVVEVNL